MFDIYLDTKDIARILKIHRETAKRLCREGKIPATKFHNTWLVTQDTLRSFKGIYVPYPGCKKKSVNKLL